MNSFLDWLTQAANTIPDTQLRQQFSQTLASVAEAAPSFVDFADKSLMLHKDYSRVIHETRQAQEAINAEVNEKAARIEQERLDLERDKAAAKDLLNLKDTATAQVEAYQKLYSRLTELEVFPVIYEDESVRSSFPVPTPLTFTPIEEEDDMPQLTEQEVAAIKAWAAGQQQPTPPASPVVAQPTQPAQQNYLTNEDAQQLFTNVFAAASIGSAKIHETTQRYKELTGKTISSVDLTMEWQQSQKPLEIYLEEKLGLSALEAQAAEHAFQQRVDARAQELIDQRVAAGALNASASAPPRAAAPLFSLLGQAPSFVTPKQPVPTTPKEPSESVTPPPAPPNSPAAFAGLDEAAQSLASGKYSGEKYNPLRPMGL